MNKIVGLKEFRENLEGYAQKVKSGDTFIVLRRSKPLFKLTPIEKEEGEWEEVIDFTKIKKGGIKIRELLARL